MEARSRSVLLGVSSALRGQAEQPLPEPCECPRTFLGTEGFEAAREREADSSLRSPLPAAASEIGPLPAEAWEEAIGSDEPQGWGATAALIDWGKHCTQAAELLEPEAGRP